jgi:ankyrin repeat protein
MFASLTGQVAIVKLFLDRGAQVNARDEQGRTALFYAAGRGYSVITGMLLEEGADPNLTDKLNKTATDYAIEADKMPVAEMLKQHGGKSSAKPKAPSAGSSKKAGEIDANKKPDVAKPKP